MKDYSGIIQDIKDNITENGKGEITGRDLREILLEAIGNVSVDMGELDRRIEAILGGENYDDIINSWAELEQFLSGLDESSNLVELLSYKADKSDVYSRSDINTKLEDYTKTDDLGALAFKDEVEMSDIKNLEDALDKKLDKEGGEIENNLLVKGELKMGVLFVPTSDGEPSSYRLAIGELGEGADIPSSGEGGLGSVTIMLGDVPYYSDSNGIVRLPAYPTGGGGDMSGYLPLSGGTIESTSFGSFEIKRTAGPYSSAVKFSNNVDGVLGYIGVLGSGNGQGVVPFWNDGTNDYTLLHSGNYSDYAVPINLSIPFASAVNAYGYGYVSGGWAANGSALIVGANSLYRMSIQGESNNTLLYRYCYNGTWGNVRYFAFTDDNVASATKLQTARLIHGFKFDGTSNVGLSVYIEAEYGTNEIGSRQSEINRYGGNLFLQHQGSSSGYSNPTGNLVCCAKGGNVLIGTTDDNGMKLQVNGNMSIAYNNRIYTRVDPNKNWSGGIFHGTYGYEAMAFVLDNALTSFMFVQGQTKLANWVDSTYNSVVPAMQIINNCVVINKLTPYGSLPSAQLEVNGNISASGYQLPTSAPSNPVSGGYYLYVGTLGAGATIS